MEVARAGEALLRHAQLLPFLAPTFSRGATTTRAANAVTRHCAGRQIGLTATRSFATTRRQLADDERSSKRATDSISSLLDSHVEHRKTTSQKPRFAPATRGSADRLLANKPRAGSSVDDLYEAMNIGNTPAPAHRSPSSFSKWDISQMMDPGFNSAGFGAAAAPPAPFVDTPFSVKLGPSVGRTIRVDTKRGFDVARAFRGLDMAMRRNRVQQDFRNQRFHERPGMKRKRLKADRWRRRFKEGFKEVVGKVHKMKKQGW